ncbi:uncharacterized protein METZ01_LOCUS20520 [marine metagenome]|uniref:Uncharacterized protein n=1 Tax=marine metagenome TaxID=408172 RepID=A0A381PKU7_9ZZZZ
MVQFHNLGEAVFQIEHVSEAYPTWSIGSRALRRLRSATSDFAPYMNAPGSDGTVEPWLDKYWSYIKAEAAQLSD